MSETKEKRPQPYIIVKEAFPEDYPQDIHEMQQVILGIVETAEEMLELVTTFFQDPFKHKIFYEYPYFINIFGGATMTYELTEENIRKYLEEQKKKEEVNKQ